MEPQLSKQEREVCDKADAFEKLAGLKGWNLALDFLRARIELAERRMWGNISADEQVAWRLQMVARERKATLDSLLAHLAEAKAARKEILMQVFRVDEASLDAAMENELEMRATALGEFDR